MTTTTNIILRRSAIEAASQCLYRYDAIWNQGVMDMSDPAARGIAFHACAHRYIMRLVEAGISTDEEEARLAFVEGIAATPDLPARLVPEVRQLFDRWTERFEVDLSAFLAAEEHQDSSDQPFTPDLVYGRPDCLEIVDFKTFWVGLSESQAKEDFQSRWYVRNAMIAWPNFPAYRFTYYFVRFGTTLSVEFTPDELDVLQREIASVSAKIDESTKSGEWPATPGAACAYCTLNCPAMTQPMLMAGRLVSVQQAADVAGKVLAAEQLLKVAKKALKGYCAVNGPISVNGMTFDNRPTTSKAYPISAVLDALKALKVDVQAGEIEAMGGDLTLSHSALKKLMKTYPELQSRLEMSAKEKVSWRFSARKPGDEDDDAAD